MCILKEDIESNHGDRVNDYIEMKYLYGVILIFRITSFFSYLLKPP